MLSSNSCFKAIVHNAGLPEGVGALSVLNTFYGRPDLPLGAYKGSFGKEPSGQFRVPFLNAQHLRGATG